MIKNGFFLIPVLLLAACSQFDSLGDKHYLRARNGARLVVPHPLSDANISHFYDLPPQTRDPVVNIVPQA